MKIKNLKLKSPEKPLAKFISKVKKSIAGKGLGKYNIIKELGRGTFGKVVSATDKKTGEKVAIKIQLNDGNEELFNKEIKILKKISKYCKNLVCIKGSGKIENNMHYIVMDFASGINLADYVFTYKLNPDAALMIINQLIEAVLILHDNGIAHSDIKPENIQIDPPTMKLQLLDLGLACDDVIKTCGGSGTPVFIPRTFSKSLSGRKSTDVWSIAATLAFMLVDYSNRASEDYIFKLLETKNVKFSNLKHVISKEYLEHPKISFILREFFKENEKDRLRALNEYRHFIMYYV